MASSKPVGTSEEKRFARAIDLYLNNAAWRRLFRTDGTVYAYAMPSPSRPGVWHQATPRTCSCEDSTFRGATCAHRIAAGMYVDEKRAEVAQRKQGAAA